VRNVRTVNPLLPAATDTHDGLAYTLWLPAGAPPAAGVVILHGAGSCKESHHDFARALVAAGFAALAFDQRGHGDSDAPLDGRAADDVAAMANVLRERLGGPAARIALRGSSMGGYMALVSAAQAGAAAVVAICPAPAELLRRGLAARLFEFKVDEPALDGFLQANDLASAIDGLEIPILLLHAEGDEQVPVQHSRELAAHLRSPDGRLIVVPGGHHRSIQHDGELQAVSLRFLQRALAPNDGRAAR
jgi:uncharacterized protein